ncbi:MAG: ergothioneine biosynthesis protein EgtC [Actinomycetota bacterium]|nr:ergothioneine biosynthesis protein EgtC [Actinomycetota bacterium]
MCRFLGYLGPPVTAETLLIKPEFSLLRQSYAPRQQQHGRFNADGWGFGWYDFSLRREPARYRTRNPMWTDAVFSSIAGLISSSSMVAAVRSATPGSPIEESGTQPFTSGPWLFLHNGTVEGFRQGISVPLKKMLSDERAGGIEGAADSEVLFALALDQLDAGTPAGEALAAVIRAVMKVSTGRLNLLLTDGERMSATAYGSSLYTLRDTERFGGPATIIASEPFDDGPGWESVPEGSLVEATANEIEIQSL